jgi:transposase
LILLDRVSYMIDINDDTKRICGPACAKPELRFGEGRRVEIRTGVLRRRRWTAKEKGRIVAEAVAPDAVIADVARRHDLAPQHLSNWIRAAKDGRFALPAESDVAFVPVVTAGVRHADNAASSGQAAPIEIAIGSFVVRIPNGADTRTLEAVVCAVRRAAASTSALRASVDK